MSQITKKTLVTALAGLLVAVGPMSSRPVGQATSTYEVRVTNLTPAQQFTPILAATHQSSATFFLPGTRASSQLRALAENGDVGPLTTRLSGRPSFMDVRSSAGLTAPGGTTVITVEATGSFDRVSLAAMLIPTNDTFVGLNAVLPDNGDVTVAYAFAYDAGTERNDEDCASIPGPDFPECGGPGAGASVGNGEGLVVISSGITGLRDFGPDRDWKNPVARVTIEKVS